MGLTECEGTFITNLFIVGPFYDACPLNDTFPIGARFHYVRVAEVTPAATKGGKIVSHLSKGVNFNLEESSLAGDLLLFSSDKKMRLSPLNS